MENSKFDMWKEGSIKFYSELGTIDLHLACVESEVNKLLEKAKKEQKSISKKSVIKFTKEIQKRLNMVLLKMNRFVPLKENPDE